MQQSECQSREVGLPCKFNPTVGPLYRIHVASNESPVRAYSKVDNEADIEEDGCKEACSCGPMGGQLLDGKVIEQGPIDGQNGHRYGPGGRLHGDPVGEAGAHDGLAGCQHQQLRSTALVSPLLDTASVKLRSSPVLYNILYTTLLGTHIVKIAAPVRLCQALALL